MSNLGTIIRSPRAARRHPPPAWWRTSPMPLERSAVCGTCARHLPSRRLRRWRQFGRPLQPSRPRPPHQSWRRLLRDDSRQRRHDSGGRQAVARVTYLIQAQHQAALAFTFAAPSEINSERRVASLSKMFSRGHGTATVLCSAESMEHHESRGLARRGRHNRMMKDPAYR